MIPFKLISIAVAALVVGGSMAATVILPKSQSAATESTQSRSPALSALSEIPSRAGGFILHSAGSTQNAGSESTTTQNPALTSTENESAPQSQGNAGGSAGSSSGNVIAGGDITSDNATGLASITFTGLANRTITAEATNSSGALVKFGNVSATDSVDGTIAPDCNPSSGSIFPIGTTEVKCSATDSKGKTANVKFDVVVSDTTPPSLVAPDDITSRATGALTQISLGNPVVTDAVDASPKVSNNAPLIGFPIGATVVTWTATDSSGNTQVAHQLVTIVNGSESNNETSSSITSGGALHLALSDPYYNDTSNGKVFVGPSTTFTIASIASLSSSEQYHYRFYPLNASNSLSAFVNGSKFRITGSDGNYIVEYYGQDSVNVRNLAVTFDSSPPASAVSIANGAAITAADRFNITATDSGSGIGGSSISGIYYSIDGNNTFTFSNNGIAVIAAGSLKSGFHSLTYYSVDSAGNQEVLKSVTFSLSDCSSMPTELMKGVVFADPVLTSTGDGQPLLIYNTPSMDSRMSVISADGFNVIRVPFYWSAYADNPAAVRTEMSNIAATAQSHKLCAIFANYQTDTGGKFGGHGFPLSLTNYYGTQKVFWTDLYANRINTDQGPRTVWNLQAEMMLDLIASVDKYSSVTGYEIINGPYVYDLDQYAKLGQYQTYIASQMRAATGKVIFFDKAEPRTGYSMYVDESHDSLTKPEGVSNLVFAPHAYDSPSGGTLADLDGYIQLAKGWNCPVFIGEWAQASLNSTKTSLDSFNSHNVGWVWWSYDPIDSYSLMDSNYKPTKHMADLLASMN